MTDVRVSQGGGLILAEASTVGVRASQAGALVLAELSAEEARVTQAGGVVLAGRADTGARVSQAGALILADTWPCITRLAQCWKITRTDGTVLAFTALDRDLVFMGVTYKSCDSLMASAAQMFSAPGSAGNMELTGIISDDAITEAELFGGLYDNAAIEVWLVPWDVSTGEQPWRLATGIAGNLSQGDLGFTMEVLTPGARLSQQALVDVYAPSCRFELGDARCTVNLAALTVTGTVDAVPVEDASHQTSRRIFTDAALVQADGYFDAGVLTWTSGANDGAVSEVKSFAAGTITLWQPMLYPISAGDAYSLVPGCDKLADTCQTKFSNYDNFGGFADVPGRDEITKTPNAKN